MNLTTYTTSNRRYVMEMVAPAADSGNKTTPTMSTIRALVEYFYRREEMAQYVFEIHSGPFSGCPVIVYILCIP